MMRPQKTKQLVLLMSILTLLASCGGSSAGSSSSAANHSSSYSSSTSSNTSSSEYTRENVAPLAIASTSFVSDWETLSAVNDNSTPESSNDKSAGAYGNWNSPNTIQWVQYDWQEKYQITGVDVYWFDDDGGVLTPTLAYLEYWSDGSWQRAGDIPLSKNTFNRLDTSNLTSGRLRLSMLHTEQSTGVLEWRVYGEETGEAVANSGSSSSASHTNNDGECDAPPAGTTSKNPLVPGIYTADPAVLVHDCTFYITAGHDEGNTGFFLRDWYVLSSSDLVNWSYNGGPVMGLGVFSWADANAWASQMVEKNGMFYWYVPVNKRGGGMAIGVAVADNPLGPFWDPIGKPLIDDVIEMTAFNYQFDYETAYTIDPTVYVDTDSRAYLAYGGFGRMVTVELGEDMTSLKGDMMENTPQGFFEAPYLTKRDNLYYMVYAAGVNPATIDYATSNSPFGPWRRRGRILDALPALPGQDYPTSHPAIAEFAGQWYLVYHISNGEGGGTYRRQVAMEKLFFNDDGTIQPVTPTTGIQH